MEELWDIIQVKVENGKLKEELKKVTDLYRIKIGQYKEWFGLKEIRKTQIEDLEKQLKKEQDKRKVEEGKLRKKLDKEKAKLDEEKEKRIEVLKERNELLAEKNAIVEKLDIAESNWVDLKMKVDDLEGEWERNRASYQRSIEELKKEKKGKDEKTSAQMTPPVAEPEKPKPLLAKHEKPTQGSMIEEEESDCQEEDNPLLQTTEGGACADLDDTDYKFKEPETPQKRRTGRKKSSKD